MSRHNPTSFKLIVDGVEYPVHSVVWSHGSSGVTFRAEGHQPRVAPDACDPYLKRWRDLVAFAATGAPPALEAEGNTSDHAWVDNSPTYSAVLAARDKRTLGDATCRDEARISVRPTARLCEAVERAVPRMQDQKPWCAESSDIEALRRQAVMRVRASGIFELPRRKRPESLNDFAREVHADNQHWWHNPATGEKQKRDTGEMLMLVVSEIAECMEGERKSLMDDHLPHRQMAEVELADAVIRIADIAGSKNSDLDNQTASCFDIPDFASDNKGAQLLRIVRAVEHCSVTSFGGFDAQLAWAIKLIEMYATKHGYDLWGAVAEKREYNKHRADHKPAARLAAGGKKF